MNIPLELDRLIAGYHGPAPRLFVAEVALPVGSDRMDLSVCLSREDAAHSEVDDARSASRLPGCRAVWVEYDPAPPRVFIDDDQGQREFRNGEALPPFLRPTPQGLIVALELFAVPARVHWLLSRIMQYGGLEAQLQVKDNHLDGVDVGGFGQDGRLLSALMAASQMTDADPEKVVAVAGWRGQGRRVSHLKIKNAPVPFVKAYLEQEA